MSDQTETAEWMPHLPTFVAESNRIEGITRAPTDVEIRATSGFLRLTQIGIEDVIWLAQIYEPGVELRTKPGMPVRFGNPIAPPSGPAIGEKLAFILMGSNRAAHPWHIHCQYETLRPLTDGNGRTGRALWAWQMVRRGYDLKFGFLRLFYYQTLEHSRSC